MASDAARAIARANIRKYYLFHFCTDFLLWAGIWIKYLTVERGFELKWILLMDTPFWLSIALLEAPLGALGDRFGRRPVMALGQLTYALTFLGFGLTTNYWMLFFDYLLWALAAALASGVDQALLYDTLKEVDDEDEFPRIVARSQAVTVSAGLTGVILGGALASLWGLTPTVQASAIIPLAGMAVALTMHEPPYAHGHRRYWHDMKQAFGFTWRRVQVRYGVILRALVMTMCFAPVVLIQPFLIEHEVATALFGVFQAPLRLVAVVAALLAFALGQRAGPARLVISGSALVIAAFAGLGLFDHTAAFALFAIPAFVQTVFRPMFDNYINARTPSDIRATVLSIASLAMSLQLALFEPILGFIADERSVPDACLFTAVWFAIILPPVIYLWRRQGLDESTALAPAIEPA